MKKLAIIVSVIFIIAIVILGSMYKETNKDYLRIHVRANSNAEVDQLVKYKIKDAVVDALIPYIANCESFEDVKVILSENLTLVNNIANSILKQNNFKYYAKSKLTSEEFPTRSYNNFVLEEGYYDALIIELGEAKGDNWWCVVYPPLCFTNSNSGSNVVYKSRIIEMIKNFIK